MCCLLVAIMVAVAVMMIPESCMGGVTQEFTFHIQTLLYGSPQTKRCSDPALHQSVANVLTDLMSQDRISEAIELAELGVLACPDEAIYHYNLGTLHFEQHQEQDGPPSRALESFRLAGELNHEYLAGYVMLLNIHGKFDECKSLLEPLGAGNHSNVGVRVEYAMAICELDQHKCEESLNILASIDVDDAATAMKARSVSNLLFKRAFLADRIGKYDLAWQWVVEANKFKMEHELAQDSKSSHRYRIFKIYLQAALRSFQSEAFQALLARQVVNMDTFSPRMIFIVGLPRSGTSLVEQILGRHTEIAAAGEMRHFDDFVAPNATCPEREPTKCSFRMETFESELGIQEARQAYYDAVKNTLTKQYAGSEFDGVKYITDKLPMNWRHIPLLKLVFPESKIIVCTRSRLDSAISNFFVDYKIPFNYWAHDLSLIQEHYANYATTMQVWRAMNAEWYELRYEDLVLNPEDSIKSLLNYLQLPYESACAEPHKSTRQSYTASHNQVKKQVYTSSVNRQKNYMKQILASPLRELI